MILHDTALSTPRARHSTETAESLPGNISSSPVAIVTSTRPVSSQIVLPPTPQLVQFDASLDDH